MSGNAARQVVPRVVPKTEQKPEKPKRTPEEEAELKRQFQLAFNSYSCGSIKDATLDKLHNHVFQGDGDYVIVNNAIGKFIVKMNDAKRPGLPEEIKGNKLELKVPKIPGKYYYQIIAFFRDICDTMGQAEAFIQFYYDTQENEYVPFVPKQTVSGSSVNYEAEDNLNEIDRDRYIFVFEIHSHNTMGAFWSATDNADEKETKFYGVFGKIKDTTVDEKFRFMVMGKQIDVKKEHIFDFSEDVIDKESVLEYLEEKEDETISTQDLLKAVSAAKDYYPEEWKDNIEKHTYGYKGYSYGYSNAYGNRHQQNKASGWSGNSASKNYWNQWDDDDDDPYGESWMTHGMGSNKKKVTQQEDTQEPALFDDPDMLDFVDIEETFDIGNYEEDIQGVIIEQFASSLRNIQVPMLLDSLVDQGHDSLMKEYFRR